MAKQKQLDTEIAEEAKTVKHRSARFYLAAADADEALAVLATDMQDTEGEAIKWAQTAMPKEGKAMLLKEVAVLTAETVTNRKITVR